MKVPRYELKADTSLMFFEFVSEGPKGRILKVVEYDETNLKGFYNLAFGDLDEKTGRINDLSISNNGDSEKVLATVVSTLYAFTDKYKNSLIYAKGSTESRTRMYRMGITKYLDEIKADFQILGFRNNEWQLFEKGLEYEAFLTQRKKN
jgi:hypothetical protein